MPRAWPALLLGACCHQEARTDAPASAPVQAPAAPSAPAAAPAESIGTATMEPDGTLVLQLRATGAGGLVGDALIRYPPGDPNYAAVLAHVGPIQPGESRPVAPFP